MTDSLVEIRVDDGIATVALSEPDRLNPLSLALQQQLLETLEQLGADRSVRALILTGAGRAFCVGADLAGMGADPIQGQSLGQWTADAMTSLSNPLIVALCELPVPVVCAVNGPAAGAGVGLALAADIVVAARSAYFYLPFLPRLGIVPDLGTTWFLPRLIGRARSTGAALLGERLSAEQAVQWGLIWACVDDGRLADEARDIATRLAALPTHAVIEARRAFDAAERNDMRAQLAYEAERQRELVDGDAFKEGVRAFLEKRPPMFRGRS